MDSVQHSWTESPSVPAHGTDIWKWKQEGDPKRSTRLLEPIHINGHRALTRCLQFDETPLIIGVVRTREQRVIQREVARRVACVNRGKRDVLLTFLFGEQDRRPASAQRQVGPLPSVLR